MALLLFSLSILFYSTYATPFLPSGSGGCNCPPSPTPPCPPLATACPAPPPPPPCPCPGAVARADKTFVVGTARGPIVDPLELQASMLGLDLNNPQRPVVVVPRQLEMLEKLSDGTASNMGSAFALNPVNSQAAEKVQLQELIDAKQSSELRRSPQKQSDTSLQPIENENSPNPADAHANAENNANGAVINTTSVVVRVDENTAQSGIQGNGSLPVDQLTTESPAVDNEGFDEQSKCNSQVLRKLMIENMTDNSNESKRKVNAAAEHKFGGNIDVVCSRGHFSYVYSSSLFCEASLGEVTCIAFRQSS
ncbi:ground-like domain-containing protein [Ditylenchus destructor]|uniref:Ground-like domain-containing protein n=1 Tax=Ditylenchus destructor TaxID=166010 RepID=A0AAD4MYQ8_9BILA|nr:ground-like domain-containing protein [Ditylenchus destructor]